MVDDIKSYFRFGLNKVKAFILEDNRRNKEEYYTFIRFMGPASVLMWPMFGYFWMKTFGLYETIQIRWLFAFAYGALTYTYHKAKTVTNLMHWWWVLLSSVTLGVYPWFMYLHTERSIVWSLSLIFFCLTMFLSVRGLDALISSAISTLLVWLLFGDALVKSDLIVFAVQFAVAMLAWPVTYTFRMQRINLESKTKDLKIAHDLLLNQEKTKDEFVAKVAHELRNPLAIVTSVVWDITDSEDTPKPVKRKLKLMQHAVERADRMVCELLDLQRFVLGVATLHKENNNVDEYAKLILKSMQYVASAKGIVFNVNVVPGMKAVFDKSRMNHVLFNLIDNAFKFVPQKTGAVFVDFYAVGNNLCIRVRDNGKGIPDEALQMIFARYYQEASERRNLRGAGIGLSLVKEVVEAHGGTVTVKSVVGVGSQFDVQIPNSVIQN